MYHEENEESSVSTKMRHSKGFCIIMNNQEKNTYVKEQLTQALIQLLKEKNIDDISVSELTQRAQVGRASFYRNYQNLSDILYQYDRLLVNTWGEKYDSDPTSDITNLFGRLFQHYKDHSDFYLLLYRNELTEAMLNTIQERCGLQPELDNQEAYEKAFWAYGIYGWLLEWMGRGMMESADDINALLQNQ